MPAACVFCGSSEPSRPELLDASLACADALADAGYDLVYGGARVGLMGAVADRMLARGREVHGVIPDFLAGKEIAHGRLTSLHQVSSMHERKLRMIELSEVFVVLPGGFGTLDELFEVLTLAQLGAHRKPTGILNADGFFTPLLDWVVDALEAGFLRPDHARLFVVEEDPAALIRKLRAHRMPRLRRWARPGDV